MKTTDPLDQKIDALLANRSLPPSDDFAVRVLAAVEADSALHRKRENRPLAKLLTFALPLAAAVALIFTLLKIEPTSRPSPNEASALTEAEAQEIFLLEESLASLASLASSDFEGEDILTTLDALYLEI